jgi:hypothetical protein
MFNLFRKTQQWSVYPLISCLLGAWLIVVSQFCVASVNDELESSEHIGVTSPCHVPVTSDIDGKSCCNDTPVCENMELTNDISSPLPVVYEVSSFDIPVFVHNLLNQFHIPDTTSEYPLYQDPDLVNLLPIDRFSVQLK